MIQKTDGDSVGCLRPGKVGTRVGCFWSDNMSVPPYLELHLRPLELKTSDPSKRDKDTLPSSLHPPTRGEHQFYHSRFYHRLSNPKVWLIYGFTLYTYTSLWAAYTGCLVTVLTPFPLRPRSSWSAVLNWSSIRWMLDGENCPLVLNRQLQSWCHSKDDAIPNCWVNVENILYFHLNKYTTFVLVRIHL